MVGLKKWQWLIASVLFVTIYLCEMYGNIPTKRLINQVVYSSEDLVLIRAVLMDITFQEDKKIPVSVDPSIEQLLMYKTIERYNKGFLLAYDQPILLNALYDGLIVFTGHTKYNGKTMSILYENGLTVTFGFVDEFEVLPYTPVSMGTLLATKEKGKLYIQIEKDGMIFNMKQTTEWIKEQQ
jgi:hypothetical protein